MIELNSNNICIVFKGLYLTSSFLYVFAKKSRFLFKLMMTLKKKL